MNAIGFAGYSGSGKTRLIEGVIPILTQMGLRVSVLKHAHHSFDIDQSGKDSYRHRQAGASEIMLVSEKRWVLMHEARGEQEPSMQDMLARFSDCDLVLVEGYKFGQLPKIEVDRGDFSIKNKLGSIFAQDSQVIALATDRAEEMRHLSPLPLLDLNHPQDVAAFIVDYFGLLPNPTLFA